MSLTPVAPLYFGSSGSAQPLPRGQGQSGSDPDMSFVPLSLFN